MAKKDYSEDLLIQVPTAAFLQQRLGWETVFAQDEEDFGPLSLLGRASDREVVLTRDVLAALRRLNPGLPDLAYTQALAQVIAEDFTKTLVQLNVEKYRLLRDGVPVSYRDAAGRLVDQRLRLIDFDDQTQNRYLAVRELWVRGRLWLRRPDIIGFVNGLPLVFIELKRFEVHVDSAYKKNFSDYLDTIPHLFHWNALVILSNGHDAQYGSITSTREHFYRWKRLDEDAPEPRADQPLLPILLEGMLHRARLLDIVENFVLFDASAGSTRKIIAHNHQYLGVNRVFDRLTSDDPKVQAEVLAGQLGVFWHTQGSGKSYAMVFLTEKIHRKISAGYTFVIITDRTELDDQIASTYTNAGRANSKTDQAQNSDALRRMLREENRRYVFGLIQKYRESVTQPYSEREDIIVISDEAHRTQYGRLALNMRKGLPRAKFIGFTGTPLIDAAEKQLTRQVFGDYVSIYDFRRAVTDGATLPLFYENRGEKLKIVDPQVNARIAKHIEAARQSATLDNPWTQEKEDKLYRELARDYPILTSPTRLDRVAQDFVDHFHQRWRVVDNGGGKAMMVCLDKPMQGHTLMQAIARVNRVGGGKKHGLIIDYNGMLKSLRKALATFAQGDRAGTGKGEDEQDTVRDDAAALAEYAASLKQARDYLAGLGFALDALIAAQGFEKQGLILTAVNLLCESDERRKTYQVIVEDVQARHRGLFPNPGLFDYDAQASAIAAVYNKIEDLRETPDVSALLQSLYAVVDTTLTTENPAPLGIAYPQVRHDLSNIDFARLRKEFERTPFKNVVTLNLKEKIEERLAMMLARNPTRVDLYERYQKIIKEYNKDKDDAEIQKVFDELNAFNSTLNEEQKRYLREDLDNEDQLAVFDLLQKDSLTRGERDAIKKVAAQLLDTLNSGKLQIDHWREKATARAQVQAEIIKHLFANLPAAAYDADEIDLKANAVFAHLYTAGLAGETRVYH
ncbi:HsdR family type I site-specific deoxyribonuclease [uncultured Thiodictyon sp.]|uniref:type I restriction endonuclease subunit R n=1 Tax=uncultured Thiodictyon sp. TaxID=1846217 RepID=UPI0025E03FC1|nr:HsdR family type I site-specific deoxyribonuclease [uncultured Thiodictyon sp.]